MNFDETAKQLQLDGEFYISLDKLPNLIDIVIDLKVWADSVATLLKNIKSNSYAIGANNVEEINLQLSILKHIKERAI